MHQSPEAHLAAVAQELDGMGIRQIQRAIAFRPSFHSIGDIAKTLDLNLDHISRSEDANALRGPRQDNVPRLKGHDPAYTAYELFDAE